MTALQSLSGGPLRVDFGNPIDCRVPGGHRANTAPVHDHAAAVASSVTISPIDTAPFRQMARAAFDDR